MNTTITALVQGTPVSLNQVLSAREQRQDIQQSMIAAYGLPLISFTLNIMGPVKVFPLAVQAFEEGIRLIEMQCHAWKLPILAAKSTRTAAGYEQFWAVRGEPRQLKEILCLLEDNNSIGRIFDIDVIQTDGQKVSRTDLGFPGRTCLICQQDAFLCSRSRAHTVEELLEKECDMMNSYFAAQYARQLSSLSMQALLYEVSVTPKPGLVDRNNTGSHKDMDIFTFEASAVSLNHYFEKFVLCGIEHSEEPFSRIFAHLRSLGIQAEDAMFKATNQVNTHKGLIFALAIMNCSLGYLYARSIPYSPKALLKTNKDLVADVLDDFQGITLDNAKTHGERLYAQYGMKGARGEALSGYQEVLLMALPRLKDYLELGLSVNDAGALTLLAIMAYSEDTNIVTRSSYETMKEVQKELRDLLEQNSLNHSLLLSYMKELDDRFISQNISPGGSADLLALTYFIYLFEQGLGKS